MNRNKTWRDVYTYKGKTGQVAILPEFMWDDDHSQEWEVTSKLSQSCFAEMVGDVKLGWAEKWVRGEDKRQSAVTSKSCSCCGGGGSV